METVDEADTLYFAEIKTCGRLSTSNMPVTYTPEMVEMAAEAAVSAKMAKIS